MSRQSRLTAQADVFSSSTSIQQLAREALVRVASRAGRVTNSNDQVAVDILFKAATGGEPLACSVAARKMLADGVPPERICEKYIPAVARQMGDDWCTDDLSFTTVTIGTARLQYLLREIGRIRDAGRPARRKCAIPAGVDDPRNGSHARGDGLGQSASPSWNFGQPVAGRICRQHHRKTSHEHLPWRLHFCGHDGQSRFGAGGRQQIARDIQQTATGCSGRVHGRNRFVRRFRNGCGQSDK